MRAKKTQTGELFGLDCEIHLLRLSLRYFLPLSSMTACLTVPHVSPVDVFPPSEFPHFFQWHSLIPPPPSPGHTGASSWMYAAACQACPSYCPTTAVCSQSSGALWRDGISASSCTTVVPLSPKGTKCSAFIYCTTTRGKYIMYVRRNCTVTARHTPKIKIHSLSTILMRWQGMFLSPQSALGAPVCGSCAARSSTTEVKCNHFKHEERSGGGGIQIFLQRLLCIFIF